MSRWEYALRLGPGATSRVLMCRLVSDSSPDPAWRDIATFGSSNDAERILGVLSDSQDKP